MRSPLTVVVVVVALAAALAVPLVATLPAVAAQPPVDGPAAPSTTGTDASTSADGAHGDLIEGTVTDEEGNPVEGAYVLVQPHGESFLQNATEGDEPIRQALADLVERHPFGLYYNATTGDGSYRVHVPRPADYEVIAVSEDGVSRLQRVSVRSRGAERNLTVDPDRVLAVETTDPSAAAGDVATVQVRVPNLDDEPIEDLTLTLSPPEGWSIERVETDGEYDPDVRQVTFDRIEPDGAATATVRVEIPADASEDGRVLGIAADAPTHFVEHAEARIGVGTPEPGTPAPTPTDERFTFEDPSTPAPSGGSAPTLLYLLSASVFAVGASFAGYAVWRTGWPGSD